MTACSRRSNRIPKSQAAGESWRGRSIRWFSFETWRRISTLLCQWTGRCGNMAREYARATLATLFGEEVVEGFYGGELVVLNVEDGVELGDVENVVNFLGKAQEFEFATRVPNGRVATHQFAH